APPCGRPPHPSRNARGQHAPGPKTNACIPYTHTYTHHFNTTRFRNNQPNQPIPPITQQLKPTLQQNPTSIKHRLAPSYQHTYRHQDHNRKNIATKTPLLLQTKT
ncbi:hypothetical protein, partial [Schleiferia thermophila]